MKEVCVKNDTGMKDHDSHGNKNAEVDSESYIVNWIKWLQNNIVYLISFNTHIWMEKSLVNNGYLYVVKLYGFFFLCFTDSFNFSAFGQISF